MRLTRLRIGPLGLTIVVMALVTAGCGGGSAMSLTSPTGTSGSSGGSTISGLVVGVPTAAPARTGTVSTLADHSVTVTVNGTNISGTVDGSGQFTLNNVPTGGPVTLSFSGSGVNASVTISNVAENEDVKITVTVNGGSAHIDSEEHHGRDNSDELSGLLSNLNTGAQTFTVNTQVVHVPATAKIHIEDTTLAFTDLKNGDEVEVRGTMSGTTLEATDVKVDHDANGD